MSVKDNIQVTYNLNLGNDFNEKSMSKAKPSVKLIELQCVYLNNDNMWKPLKCESSPNTTAATCQSCESATNTALSYVICSDSLMRVPVFATLVVEGISAVFIALTMFFLLFARLSRVRIPQPSVLSRSGIRGNLFLVQFSICLSLFLLHIFVALSGVPAVIRSSAPCYFIAFGMHFTILSSAIWLLNQGISLLLKIGSKHPLRLDYKLLTGMQILIGWGAPLLIVGLIFLVGEEDYVATDSFALGWNDTVITGKTNPRFGDCHFNQQHNAAFISVTATIGIIILINVTVTSHTVLIIHKISKENSVRRLDARGKNHFRREKQLLRVAYWRNIGRALLLLLPVSTIPWIAWMFALLNEDVVHVVFTASSGVQGFGIFLIFCLFNADDRERIRISWSRSKIRDRCQRTFALIFERCRNRLSLPKPGIEPSPT